MQTLHLRADDDTIYEVLKFIDAFNKKGKKIELLDTKFYELEKNMILTALKQIQNGESFSHKDVWNELLENEN